MRRVLYSAVFLLAGMTAPAFGAAIVTVAESVTITDYCDTIVPAPCPGDPNSDTNSFTVSFSNLPRMVTEDGFSLTVSGVGDHDTEMGAEEEWIALSLDDSVSLGTILDRNADNDLFDNRGFRSASFCCNIDGALDNDLFEMTAPLESSLIEPLLADGVLTIRITFGSGVDNPGGYTELLSFALSYDTPLVVPAPAAFALMLIGMTTLAGSRRQR